MSAAATSTIGLLRRIVKAALQIRQFYLRLEECGFV